MGIPSLLAESFGFFTAEPVSSSSYCPHHGEIIHRLARRLSKDLSPGKGPYKSFAARGHNSQVLPRDQLERDINLEPIKLLLVCICWPPERISPRRPFTWTAVGETVKKAKLGFGDPHLSLSPQGTQSSPCFSIAPGSNAISPRGDLK